MAEYQRERVKVTLEFTVNTDQVPGVFYDGQDFADHVRRYVESTFVAYKPSMIKSEAKPHFD